MRECLTTPRVPLYKDRCPKYESIDTVPSIGVGVVVVVVEEENKFI